MAHADHADQQLDATRDTLQLAMVAGEASGDLLGASLLAGLKGRWPRLSAGGIGGPAMQSHGFDAWWPYHRLAVRGYVEVLRHYLGIAAIRRELLSRLLRDKPDLFIGVDAPDFNLHLEQRLRQAGVRTVHFISPSIWAWRAGRIGKIRRAVDHMLCIFPFEPDLYRAAGVAATYVGHPLAAVIPLQPDPAAARARLGLSVDRPLVALLPGSRRSEIDYILPLFAQAVCQMAAQRGDLRFVLPAVPALRERVDALLAQAGAADLIEVVQGRSHDVLEACDVTLIASGTATLEAALFKRPMVIAYRMHPLSWRIMRPMALQPWVGLPNILCRDFVVPELLQSDATAQSLARETLAWLDQPEKAQALGQRFLELHHVLLRDTAREAADAIEKTLGA